MLNTNGRLGAAAVGNTSARSAENDVEVHAVNTSAGVVLHAKIDMLLNTEAKVTSLAEVLLAQLELLYLIQLSVLKAV